MNDFLLRGQSIESLRLQLPPGPISAILALCQMQLHHQAFISAVHECTEQYTGQCTSGRSHCASFGRLVISLATDPDFRKAMDGRKVCSEASGSSGTSLALRSISQLQRSSCIKGLMPSELGRLRFLQAQSSALQALHEKPPEDPAPPYAAANKCGPIVRW